MASDVGIANLALLKLGKNRIASFQDGSVVADIFVEQYGPLRDILLRMGWNFSRAYAALAATTTPPPFQYTLAFNLPSDFIRLEWAGPAQNYGTLPPGTTQVPLTVLGMPGANLSDYNNALCQDYRVVGRQIWSNIGTPLSIIYHARITDPNMFDTYFVEAFAWFLAMELCETITGSNSKFPRMAQGYNDALAQARKFQALENPPTTIPDDTWMLARISS
jgi:hypothetical protein